MGSRLHGVLLGLQNVSRGICDERGLGREIAGLSANVMNQLADLFFGQVIERRHSRSGPSRL